jgi:DNA polymerase III gamma/tau subunit
VTKIVTKFVEMHPSTSKRQVEMKITEVAIKEKRATDTQKVMPSPLLSPLSSPVDSSPCFCLVLCCAVKVWHLKREWEHLLEDPVEKQPVAAPAAASESKKKSETTKKRKSVETAAPVATAVEPETKPASKKSRAKEPAVAAAETPVPKAAARSTSTSSSSAAAPPVTPKTEKKVKTAFEIFVKEKRAEVEETLGSNADVRYYPSSSLSLSLSLSLSVPLPLSLSLCAHELP